jgi:hypothetical protein
MASSAVRDQIAPSKTAPAVAGWKKHAEALADWTLARVVVRKDVYGGHKPDGSRFTSHEPVTREVLIRHYRGEITIGVHSISPDNLCLALTADIDAHDETADQEVNWRCAMLTVEALREFKLSPLVCDSNGQGGYHVRQFFKKPIPAAAARWLGELVNSRLQGAGLPVIEEFFPKQGEVTLQTPYGNWLRLPGRHHKREHWTRIYEPLSKRWLEGESAAKALIKVAGDAPTLLLKAFGEQEAKSEAPKSNNRVWQSGNGRLDHPEEAKVRAALTHLPNGDRSYDEWLAVGMALNDWDQVRGLAVWLDWSSQSTKHNEATGRAKWGSFSPGGGLTVASIFKAASENGWDSHPSANGNGHGPTTLNTLTRTPPSDFPEDEVEPPIVVQEWPAPLDLAAYFGLAGEIVQAIEPQTEGDPAAILVQLLVAVGNMIGRSPYARVGRAFHHANEFTLMIGETSAGRKGTAWSEVEPLLRPIDEAWCGRLGPGLSSGEGIIYHVRDKVVGQEPIKDKSGRVTDYQEVIVDHGAADKRLMVVETEFARALQAMQRDGATLNSIVRQAFDGGLLRSLTKGFPYQATGAHISIIGHITSQELHKLLASTDLANGFTNRFLWVACRRMKLLPFGGQLDPKMIDHFVKCLREAIAFARSVKEVTWTRKAMDLWVEQYPLLTAPRPGALGSVVNRGEAHALRVAMLTALINEKSKIEAEHLRASLAIVAYSERSAAYMLGDRVGDRDEAAILAYLKCRPGSSRTELRRGVFHDNKPAFFVDEKLTSLLQKGSVRRESQPTAGRPREAWFSTSPPT